MDLESDRRVMVEEQIRARDISDANVLNAMLKVERHRFIPEERWDEAYADYPLPIGYGQTISQPYIVALMTQLLELRKSDRVLEIGTGSGYQTAILCEICKEVISIERIPELCKYARKNLKGIRNVKMINSDGSKGYVDGKPYDGIIVTAATKKMPMELLNQLSEGGRIVIPVGDFSQKLVLFKKSKEGLKEKYICDVRFVPLIENVYKANRLT